MKKLMTTLMILTCSMAFAQELTADTVASSGDPTVAEQIIRGLIVALLSFLTYMSTVVIPLINAWLKTLMHFRGSSVVADALTVALSEFIADVRTVAADGDISTEERKWIMSRARDIAAAKLKNLSGFYKQDLLKWIDEVLEVEMGKLLSRIFSYKSSSSANL